jgi:hypothetical protein
MKRKCDTSTKPYEIVYNSLTFDKNTRNFIKHFSCCEWCHMRYYNTLKSAENALRDFRKHRGKIDYPGDDFIKNHPDWKYGSKITITRFKIQKNKI